jgi:hypothetical protein
LANRQPASDVLGNTADDELVQADILMGGHMSSSPVQIPAQSHDKLAAEAPALHRFRDMLPPSDSGFQPAFCDIL